MSRSMCCAVRCRLCGVFCLGILTSGQHVANTKLSWAVQSSNTYVLWSESISAGMCAKTDAISQSLTTTPALILSVCSGAKVLSVHIQQLQCGAT